MLSALLAQIASTPDTNASSLELKSLAKAISGVRSFEDDPEVSDALATGQALLAPQVPRALDDAVKADDVVQLRAAISAAQAVPPSKQDEVWREALEKAQAALRRSQEEGCAKALAAAASPQKKGTLEDINALGDALNRVEQLDGFEPDGLEDAKSRQQDMIVDALDHMIGSQAPDVEGLTGVIEAAESIDGFEPSNIEKARVLLDEWKEAAVVNSLRKSIKARVLLDEWKEAAAVDSLGKSIEAQTFGQLKMSIESAHRLSRPLQDPSLLEDAVQALTTLAMKANNVDQLLTVARVSRIKTVQLEEVTQRLHGLLAIQIDRGIEDKDADILEGVLGKARQIPQTGALAEKVAEAKRVLGALTTRRAQSIWDTEGNDRSGMSGADLSFDPLAMHDQVTAAEYYPKPGNPDPNPDQPTNPLPADPSS